MPTYRTPKKRSPKDRGRYDGNSPVYRRNQAGDYSSNADRYEKAQQELSGLIDQNNPWKFTSERSDNGYWTVYKIENLCQGCGPTCPGESAKLLYYPGSKPLRIFLAYEPTLDIQIPVTHLQIQRWSSIPTSMGDIPTLRSWVANVPINSRHKLQPGIYSFMGRNRSGGHWDTICFDFGGFTLGTLTLNLISF